MKFEMEQWNNRIEGLAGAVPKKKPAPLRLLCSPDQLEGFPW